MRPHGLVVSLSGTRSAWIETKQTPNKGTFPLSGDPSRRSWPGSATPGSLRIPYLLAIRWKPDGMWSMADAVGLMAWVDAAALRPKSVERVALESRWGVSCATGQLSSILRAALIEGL